MLLFLGLASRSNTVTGAVHAVDESLNAAGINRAGRHKMPTTSPSNSLWQTMAHGRNTSVRFSTKRRTGLNPEGHLHCVEFHLPHQREHKLSVRRHDKLHEKQRLIENCAFHRRARSVPSTVQSMHKSSSHLRSARSSPIPGIGAFLNLRRSLRAASASLAPYLEAVCGKHEYLQCRTLYVGS